MNVLHYLNVAIGFALVMLVLSMVTSTTAQILLALVKTKARAVGNGLTGLLEDIGLGRDSAKAKIDALLDKGNSILGNNKAGKILGKISAFLLFSAPKNIGREEFVLLLMRQAKVDDALAKELGFTDKVDASTKLDILEQEILKEETADPSLASQVWRSKAMQTVVPELAAKIFARFDDVIERVNEEVSLWGKVLVVLITLPLLLVNWPVDSVELFNRLSNDAVLSSQLSEIASKNVPTIEEAQNALIQCRKDKAGVENACEDKKQALDQLANGMVADLDAISGLLGQNRKTLTCEPVLSFFIEDCKRAKLTSGIFITWVLVSLGSAFWLGVLNKMLGIRSEFNKKLEAQRDFRANSQQ